MFRWCSPDVEALGWDVLRIPTQESIQTLGIEAYNANLRSLIRYWRPHIFLVHPPYDYLLPGTLAAAKKVGTRLVAFGFDDPLFIPDLQRKGQLSSWCASVNLAFDLYASTSAQTVAVLQEHGLPRAVHMPFATSEGPFQQGAEGAPPAETLAKTAVIVGRAYPKRLRLVEDLLERGVPVSVFGHGWTEVGETPEGLVVHGPLRREAMNAVNAHAGVVITTGCWEDRDVRMVKYRLLEVAMVGGFQVVEACEDLADTFPADMVMTFDGGADLAATIQRMLAWPERRALMARNAQAHVMTHHRWRQQFPRMLAVLAEQGRPLREEVMTTSPAGYRTQLMILGHRHELDGSHRLAQELFEEVARRFPSDVAARHALARLAAKRGDHDREATESIAALEASLDSNPVTSRGVFMEVPRNGQPLGLGESGYLHPGAELQARAILSLAQTGRGTEALERVNAITDPDACVAIAALLTVPRLPTQPELWIRLLQRATDAQACQLKSLQNREVPQWEADLQRLRAQLSG